MCKNNIFILEHTVIVCNNVQNDFFMKCWNLWLEDKVLFHILSSVQHFKMENEIDSTCMGVRYRARARRQLA